MFPFVLNGETWSVIKIPPGNTRLIDRTGSTRLATTDPEAKVIYLDNRLLPPLLDRVLIHEVAHAITVSYGLLDSLHAIVPRSSWVQVEEWAVGLVENFGLEASLVASESLGRPVCVRHNCVSLT